MQIHLKLSPSPRPRPAYQLRLFRRTTATPHSVILLIVLQFRHQRLGQYHHLDSIQHSPVSFEYLLVTGGPEQWWWWRKSASVQLQVWIVPGGGTYHHGVAVPVVISLGWWWPSLLTLGHQSVSTETPPHPHTVTQCTTITLLPLLCSLRSEWVCRMWIYDHNGDCLQDWNYMTISLFLYSPKQI